MISELFNCPWKVLEFPGISVYNVCMKHFFQGLSNFCSNAMHCIVFFSLCTLYAYLEYYFCDFMLSYLQCNIVKSTVLWTANLVEIPTVCLKYYYTILTAFHINSIICIVRPVSLLSPEIGSLRFVNSLYVRL